MNINGIVRGYPAEFETRKTASNQKTNLGADNHSYCGKADFRSMSRGLVGDTHPQSLYEIVLESMKQGQRTVKPEKAGQPEKAGRPEEMSQPEKAGQPEEMGQPEEVSRPEEMSQSEEAKQSDRIKQSDEEKQRDSDEEQTDTEIIVKADGSKVMMTTIRVGGMETVMSMKIAEPAGMPSGNADGTIEDSNLMTSDTNAVIASVPEK